MRAEEGGNDVHRCIAPDPARGAQLAQLGVDVEAVARLDLDGGDPFGEKGPQSIEGERGQAVLVRLPGRLHRRQNAAAAARDLFVGHAFEALLELRGTAPRVHEVGVAVDEPRRDPGSTRIVPEHVRRDRLGQSIHRTHPGDALARHRNGAGVDRPVRHLGIGCHGREPSIHPEHVPCLVHCGLACFEL